MVSSFFTKRGFFIFSVFAVGLLLSFALYSYMASKNVDVVLSGNETGLAKAVFAGGCFWCMEHDFKSYEGVSQVVSGYSGGEGENPTYGDYAEKGHIEVIEVSYNSSVVSYGELLEYFWKNVDPSDSGGQFCDRGRPYISAIFYNNSEEKKLAEESKKKVGELLGLDVATEIIAFEKFYPAEEYHQGYSEKNPLRYKFYRASCGRDSTLEKVWGNVTLDFSSNEGGFVKPSDEELKATLTPIQYKVTQKDGTEKPFDNLYWDNKEEGIYVDIISGEVLFSSKDKYKSGTGWPSFTKPLVSENIVEKEDNTLFTARTEVRSLKGDNHLGHVFEDGPEPTGLRYCMNSAALRFVRVSEMESEGYGEWLSEFE